jgi:hypothetical protein
MKLGKKPFAHASSKFTKENKRLIFQRYLIMSRGPQATLVYLSNVCAMHMGTWGLKGKEKA